MICCTRMLLNEANRIYREKACFMLVMNLGTQCWASRSILYGGRHMWKGSRLAALDQLTLWCCGGGGVVGVSRFYWIARGSLVDLLLGWCVGGGCGRCGVCGWWRLHGETLLVELDSVFAFFTWYASTKILSTGILMREASKLFKY